jgi:hypothetical protein
LGLAQAGAGVSVGVAVGVIVGVGVSVGVLVGVIVGVAVGVEVSVGEAVSVAVGGTGVLVGSDVFDGFIVSVGGIGVFVAQANRLLAQINEMRVSQKRFLENMINILLDDNLNDYNENLEKEKSLICRNP